MQPNQEISAISSIEISYDNEVQHESVEQNSLEMMNINYD